MCLCRQDFRLMMLQNADTSGITEFGLRILMGLVCPCTRSLRHAVGWHSLARTQVTDLSPQHIPDHWSSGDVKAQERSQAQGRPVIRAAARAGALAPKSLAGWDRAVLGPTVGRQPGFHGPCRHPPGQSSCLWDDRDSNSDGVQLGCSRAMAGSQAMFNCRVTLAPPLPAPTSACPVILGRAINPSKHFPIRSPVRTEPATRP